MSQIKSVKSRRFWRAYFRSFWKGVCLPLTDGPSLFQFILLLAFVAILWEFYPGLLRVGRMTADDQIKWVVWFIALVFLAIPIWVVIQAIAAFFRTKSDLEKLGYWVGRKFIYRQPVFVETFTVQTFVETLALPVKFTDAEPNSLVSWRVEIEGPTSRMTVTVEPSNVESITGALQASCGSTLVFPLSGSVRVNGDKVAALYVNALPNTDAATIRVLMLSWEI